MKLISNNFKDFCFLDSKYSMDGGNVSPHLKWINVPEETKSLAILVHDPDAPIASGFWHWQIVNIPVTLNEIAEGSSKKMQEPILEKNNDGDFLGWYGPQPPKGHGVHRYVFELVALDIEKLQTNVTQSRAYTAFMIWSHTIATAKITALYKVD